MTPKLYIPSLLHGPNVGSSTPMKPLPIHMQGRVFWALFLGGWLVGYFMPWVFYLTTLASFGLCAHWARFWAWTHALIPPEYQADLYAANGRWDDMTSVLVDTGKYLDIKDKSLARYKKRKIPLFTFIEAYRHGKIDVRMDLQVALRHYEEWAITAMNLDYMKFLFFCYIPETFFHNRGQDHHQVTEHYNTGNDFFGWYLGNRMVYTCGYFITGDETLEKAQDQKMQMVAKKIGLKEGQRLLDLGCGWGTWALYAASRWGVDAHGLSISQEQLKFATARQKANGIENVTWHCKDYRDMPMRPRFDRITCFEMAEHVGIRRFRTFLRQVYDALEDDGIFYLQIAGLREAWQHEDVVWGLFMDRYIFRGADASLPLNWVTSQCETEGFEVHSVETIGVHYATTIDKWYQNWQKNKAKVIKTYDQNYFRTYEIFLGWSAIIPEKGCSTCFQLVLHKNLDNFDRRRFWGEGPKIYDMEESKLFSDIKTPKGYDI